jgi:hypothetical protein
MSFFFASRPLSIQTRQIEEVEWNPVSFEHLGKKLSQSTIKSFELLSSFLSELQKQTRPTFNWLFKTLVLSPHTAQLLRPEGFLSLFIWIFSINWAGLRQSCISIYIVVIDIGRLFPFFSHATHKTMPEIDFSFHIIGQRSPQIN